MIIVGSHASVGVGGFLTGGGQSLLSSRKGLAADNVLAFSIVLPSGEIVTANACQNADIFWAVRGGGGSTFGVVLNFTVKAFASEKVASLEFGFRSPTGNEDAFWEGMRYMATQFPRLGDAEVTTFASLTPGNTTTSWAFGGAFHAANKSIAELTGIMQPLADHLNSKYGPDIQAQITDVKQHASYYEWFIAQQEENNVPAGIDFALASRILDEKALNHPNFTSLMKKAAGSGGVGLNGVAGPGTHGFPRDFNAATPVWRTGYVHASMFIVSPFWKE